MTDMFDKLPLVSELGYTIHVDLPATNAEHRRHPIASILLLVLSEVPEGHH